MDSVALSDLERYYVIQGAELGCRTDGRSAEQYRPLEIETGILSHASGSASIRIGGTYFIGCVKAEVGKPLATKPNEGRLEINVECYPTAMCTPTDKGANEIADNLKATLQSVYAAEVSDLQSLCIQPGRQCWVVYCDLLILEGDGNFLDAASIVIKAALLDSSRHFGSLKSGSNCLPRFGADRLPLFVTVHKVGRAQIVDASREEEACSLSTLSVAVYPDGRQGAVTLQGCGSCQLDTVCQMTQLARAIGCELNTSLTKTLQLEEQLRN